VTAMKGVSSYSNPQADGQSYTGTFQHSETEARKESDHTCTIIQTLTLATGTEQTSGTLVVGKEYILVDWITGDDFSNIGATNEDGNVFTATGTTPTTWTNSSVVLLNIAEADAVLVNRNVNPREPGDKIVRRWPYILKTVADVLVTTLRGTNTYATVQADGQIYVSDDQLWQNSGVEVREERDRTCTITQVVTMASVQLDDDSATLVNRGVIPRGAGDKIVRRWPYIVESYADNLITAARSTKTVKDPVVDDETITGTFGVGRTWGEEQQDNTITIAQELTLFSADVTTLTEAEAQLVGERVDPRVAGDTLQRRWPYINPAVAETLIAAAVGSSDYEIENPQADAQTYTGWFVVSKAWSVEERDGTCTIYQILTKLATTVAEADAHLLAVPQRADIKLSPTQVIREWRNVRPTTADTLAAALRATATFTNPKADNQVYTGVYTNSDVTTIRQENRAVTIRQVLTLPNNDIAAANAYVRVVQADVGKTEQTHVRYWPNVTATSEAALVGGIAVADFTVGSTTYIHDRHWISEDTETGLKTVFQQGRIPKNAGSGSVYAIPYKVSIVGHGNHAFRVTEDRNYRMEKAGAIVFANESGGAPKDWGGEGRPAHKQGYIIKEPEGSLYTGVKIVFVIDEPDIA